MSDAAGAADAGCGSYAVNDAAGAAASGSYAVSDAVGAAAAESDAVCAADAYSESYVGFFWIADFLTLFIQ